MLTPTAPTAPTAPTRRARRAAAREAGETAFLYYIHTRQLTKGSVTPARGAGETAFLYLLNVRLRVALLPTRSAISTSTVYSPPSG